MRTVMRTRALCGAPTTPFHCGRRLPVPSYAGFHSKSGDSSEVSATAAKLPDAGTISPVTPRQRVTVADIAERRTKAGRLVAPTAAYSDADMFKAPVSQP